MLVGELVVVVGVGVGQVDEAVAAGVVADRVPYLLGGAGAGGGAEFGGGGGDDRLQINGGEAVVQVRRPPVDSWSLRRREGRCRGS
ncbi:hypothetical protein [Micromonospora echinaurantiaca]|uniref:hypothetical protein n=1 Tax=Micromonospora echinaurantiaca TaxID=47857 RepID=UPI0012FE4CB9|nr:hypothetical protein [Micromonospora echinaurantiaca]